MTVISELVRPRVGAQRHEGPAPQAPSPRPRLPVSLALVLGLVGALLLWAAFPPLDLPWLAWLAPVPWLLLVQVPRLPGRQPYACLWLAGFVHWLIMLQGIRLAHPALYAGWLALAAYLGVYLPLFVGLTRVARQRFRIPLVLAAPAVWVGLEVIRGHLITGFSLCLLAHSQADFPWLIQVSDLAGGYTLSFVIMLVAACLARACGAACLGRVSCAAGAPDRLTEQPPIVLWPVALASVAMMATLGYGAWRLAQTPPGAAGPVAHIALIQGSMDTVFEVSAERMRETFAHYGQLTAEATRQHSNLDLVIWPESMFMASESAVEEPLVPPPAARLTAEEVRQRVALFNENFQLALSGEAARANAHTSPTHGGTDLLVGTTTVVYGSQSPRIYNAALLANRRGEVVARYYKMHPVMFGEYIPFGDAIPWLYRVTPMSGGLSCGDGPRAFEIAGLRMSPSVCFESTIPHLIRGQLAILNQKKTPADCLVNITNDGWFWGSAILEQHFRCGQFRAVENRKPLLVAANTGVSGWIDGNGVVKARGQRRVPRVLLADVRADGRQCLYFRVGDVPAWLTAGLCLTLAVAGIQSKLRKTPKLP